AHAAGHLAGELRIWRSNHGNGRARPAHLRPDGGLRHGAGEGVRCVEHAHELGEERPMAESTLIDQSLRELAEIDSPTIANAVDSFHVRDATEGFAGSELRCVYPD